MTPEDVCASLARPHAPASPDRDNGVLANIAASYFMLRRGMAALAFALPAILWVGGGLEGSLSAYYHADGGRMRDVFVGALWAIGAFLFLYRGYSTAEDRALDGAGLLAVVTALAPMDWPRHSVDTVTGAVHYAAAIGFFLLIAYVCLFRSGDTLELMRDEARAARFRATYRCLGALMVLLPAAVWAVHRLLPRPDEPVALFFVESAGVWVFAAFWMVKSREIAVLERQ
ncbi:MAG TPA: hypothetical protein VF636_00600 [Sphingomonas sp.]|jgi:hypothetical protein